MMQIPGMTEQCVEVAPLIAARAAQPLATCDEAMLAEHIATCERCASVAAIVWLDRDTDQVADRRVERRVLSAAFSAAIDPGAAHRHAPAFWSPGRIAVVVAAAAAIVLALWFSRQQARERAMAGWQEPEQTSAPVGAGRKRPVPAKSKPAKSKSHQPPSQPTHKPPADKKGDAAKPDRPGRDDIARMIEGAAATLPERLGREEITRGIAKARPGIERCADVHQFDGRVAVTIRVAASGKVLSAQPPADADDAGQCVARVLRKLRFPAARESITIRYPFVLRSRGAAGQTAADLAREAQDAARAQQYGRALRLCERALAIETSQDAVIVCGVSACNLRSEAKASKYISQITSSNYKMMVRQLCLKNGVQPEATR